MEDAAQMAALQIHVEFGPGLADNPEAFEGGLERFVTTQVHLRSHYIQDSGGQQEHECSLEGQQ